MRDRIAFGRLWEAGALIMLGLGVAALPAAAAEKDLTDKGRMLVEKNCARCHAIGKEGASAHPEAPPFRTLSSRYPIDDLAESLAEGIVSGHPDMPIFVFGPTDVEAIITYLKSIQDQPAPKPSE
ncbi:cytochrome c [Methyloceanibacter sp.]|uniref:c-type cytochrome n=1 Tax=Methyloceanibacter sp. TaxID=1965321 RepID=UPI002D613AD8|nr:cytochrome c [Methyloceanibacter sp.]HZP09669.1 cytochrome c [Methyloceanibacter sp.]